VLQDITIQQQSLSLHPNGAIFWKEKNALLIADVHLGKVSHFRKHGSAVPQQALLDNFIKLDEVLHYFGASTLYFLGDLFHSYINQEWILFEEWVKSKTIKIVLIAGNHDIISPQKFENIGVSVCSERIVDNFLFTHHPKERTGFFNFCGHIHPGVMLSGFAKQRLLLPCFYQSKYQMILPAFGVFTGTHILEFVKDVKIYAVTKNEVILVTD